MPTDEIAIRVSREFKPYAGLHGVLMGALVIRMGTITGARLGEAQQIAQNPDCVKKLEKVRSLWVLRLFPEDARFPAILPT